MGAAEVHESGRGCMETKAWFADLGLIEVV
jgi:hypothetical protein